MATEWLKRLREEAYFYPDPDRFLSHCSESGSRKKFWFVDGNAVWMALEARPPLISRKTFKNEKERDQWIKANLQDFDNVIPLTMVYDELA